jgi:iron complex outermembrane receptor protein/outer membrane receptor for ferrienterochelin and colicins
VKKKTCALIIILLAGSLSAWSQQQLRIQVKDRQSLDALDGATVAMPSASTVTDRHGIATFKNVPAGTAQITCSYTGYITADTTFDASDTSVHVIYLEHDAAALHDVVVVATTRANDRIENSTTKVEVLTEEEMNEESTLKPGNIASILGDISGVQIQQSSAISGNTNVRMQGLQGRYTQILLDGMPLYGGYSGGFGVLSIAPLDLKQVELIKGSSSTLYGGGAIAGLINLVSKKPSETPELTLLANETTLKETNLNAYFSQRWKKAGITLFAGQTFQQPIDVNEDGLTDLPDTKSTTIHPTLFIYPSHNTSISIGWAGSFENRTGGDMIHVKGNNDAAHPFFENNKLDRNSFTLIGNSKLNPHLSLVLKSSVSLFNRKESTNTYIFNGHQTSHYSELSILASAKKHNIVAGINVTGERFNPSSATPVPVGTLSQTIVGIFAQDTWKLSDFDRLEIGARADHEKNYGSFFLPRIALFHRFNSAWGSRVNFGMGYSIPNALDPQIKDYNIYQLQPLSDNMRAERSLGGNFDVNYRLAFSQEGSFFINQSFFVTRINHPAVAVENPDGTVSFESKDKPVTTTGFDSYIQLSIQRWEIYLGYTYTEALRKYEFENQFIPYTPRNRAAGTAVFQVEDKWMMGVEASYNGSQYREDGSKTHDYWFTAAMIERKIGAHWSIVMNCENLFDARQSRYESLYTGPISDPDFKPLWAPIDGRVLNLCLRYRRQ